MRDEWSFSVRMRSSHSVDPRVPGEFDDFALAKVFGEGGAGALFVPTAIAGEGAPAVSPRPVLEHPGDPGALLRDLRRAPDSESRGHGDHQCGSVDTIQLTKSAT
jgi:hypothetical protein